MRNTSNKITIEQVESKTGMLILKMKKKNELDGTEFRLHVFTGTKTKEIYTHYSTRSYSKLHK